MTQARESTRLTRRQLYDLVWSTPIWKLAARFGCSDVWLSKICRACEVPTPPRGYWAKVQAGQSPRKKRLRRTLDPDEVVLDFTPHDPQAEPPPPEQQLDDDFAAAMAKLDSLGDIVVPRSVLSPHPLVAQAREALRARNSPHAPYRRSPLAIDVANDSLGRALRIFHTLLTTLKGLGFETKPAPDGACKAAARTSICGEFVVFRLRERLTQNRTSPAELERDPFCPRVTYEHKGSWSFNFGIQTVGNAEHGGTGNESRSNRS